MSCRILLGDCRDTLKKIAPQSVQTVVTSPPYWGLRDYKLEPSAWEDGWTGCLGLEPTPDLYVEHLVSVFREVWRVLRDDGTVWLNLGDSFNGSGRGPDAKCKSGVKGYGCPTRFDGLKPKDLVGVPWMTAFALRVAGWYLRSDIVWAKGYSFHPKTAGSCMPESIKDRPTRGHEYLFLLSKSPRYYYDAEAVKEEGIFPAGTKAAKGSGEREGNRRGDGYATYSGKRNLRSVWLVNPKPFKAAHFATFPPTLVEPCVKAGSREGDTVLDPFAGSGTTGLVAHQLGRSSVLCEANLDYASIALGRLRDVDVEVE